MIRHASVDPFQDEE